MKKENINNYYTEEDLINFKKLNNFEECKTNILKDNQVNKNPIKYSASDNNNFKKIIQFKNNETNSSKEVNISKKNTYYNPSDFKKFEKLKQFTNLNFNENSKNYNKYSKNITSYTSKDLDRFNKIIKTKNDDLNIVRKNKKIKIIDFNKIKEKEKNLKNKLGVEKIKVVYFD